MSARRCRILTIGDELINGSRVDTNTAWLSGRLEGIGVHVDRAVSVGDSVEQIFEEVGAALESADILIMSGGLGPTQDDRTKEALAAYFGAALIQREDVEASVRAFFEERDRIPSQVNLDQALVPEGFSWHVNPVGTAPGLMMETQGRLLFALPGVPGEMKALFDEWIGPLLTERFGGRAVIRKAWYRTTGIGESDLYERIGGLEDLAPAVSLAYLPSPDGVAMYVTARSENGAEAEALLAEADTRVRKGAGTFLFGVGDQSLAAHLARLLTDEKKTLATAESCTGGRLAGMLTDVPGASVWFLQGWVTYTNDSKVAELGVSEGLLETHGAVSEEVAGAMAEGARRRAGSDHALAITGIAGPTGGTEEKPVGTVCVAHADEKGTTARTFHLGSTGRGVVRRRSAAAAMDLLRRRLEGLPMEEGGWVTPR